MELIGNLIYDILKENNKENIYFEGLLKIKWQEVVGETIANESYPDRIQNNILYVACKNSSFKQEIFFLKNKIIERVNNLIKDNLIEDIKVFMRRN